MTNTGAGPMTAAMTLTSVPTRLTPACLLEQPCDRKAFFACPLQLPRLPRSWIFTDLDPISTAQSFVEFLLSPLL